MSRTLSSEALRGMLAPETDLVWVILLTITHDDLAMPIYVANDVKNHTSNGVEYIGYPFAITLPNEAGEELSTVSLTIDNVSRELVETIRTLTSPPTLTLMVIKASDPDLVEYCLPDMELKNVTYDALQITGELGWEAMLSEAWPCHAYTPGNAPGLFT